MTRKAIPETVQEEILTRSARRCALCFGFEGRLSRVAGQLAHLDRDSSNSTAVNIVYLCLPHHDEYDSTTSQSKGLTHREVENYRARLYDAIAAGLHHEASERSPQARPDYLEHDRAAFQAGNTILSESYLRDFLDHVGMDHCYHLRQLHPVTRFVEHFRMESARYLLSDLLTPLDDLVAALDAFSVFLAIHFFSFPTVQARDDENGPRCCLYPDHNMDRGGSGAPNELAFYGARTLELMATIERVEDTFREYRRTVKRTLVV